MGIETEKALSKWLEKQSQETCAIFAARAAGRVFPRIMMLDHEVENQELVLLYAARAILTAQVSAIFPTVEIRNAAGTAAELMGSITQGKSDNAALYSGAEYAFCAATHAAMAAKELPQTASYPNGSDHASSAAYFYSVHFYKDQRVSFFDAGLTKKDLLRSPLWPRHVVPKGFKDAFQGPRNLFETSPSWNFWSSWFEKWRKGEPLDWELIRRVVLIKNVVWKAGPKAIAEEIARIEAAFEVEKLRKNWSILLHIRQMPLGASETINRLDQLMMHSREAMRLL